MCATSTALLAFLTVINSLAIIVAVLLGFSADPYLNFLIPGLFERGLANVSSTYEVYISPVNGTYAFWGVVFLWQFLWAIYSLTAICRKTGAGSLISNPVLLPPTFHLTFLVGVTLTVAWMFLWDRLFISLALVVMLFTAAFLFLALVISYKTLEESIPLLAVQGRHFDIWAVRIFVQNGVALYATWATVESVLIFASVLTYTSVHTVSEETSSIIALGILAGFILLYAVTDYFPFDSYSRFVLTPYVVVMVALSLMFAKDANVGAVSSIFTLVLLAVSAVLSLTKLFFICFRQITKNVDSAENIEFLKELDETKHLLKGQ